MYFTEEALAQLATEFRALDGKYDELCDGYFTRIYVSDRGREFGHHGFLRRIQSLRRCIHHVYELMPPESEERPDDDVRHDTELNIQAFIFNIFGAADNLAWIWVSEKNIRRADGNPIPVKFVGIRKNIVRDSFTERFRTLLDAREDWFTYLEGFRHWTCTSDSFVHSTLHRNACKRSSVPTKSADKWTKRRDEAILQSTSASESNKKR